MSSRRSVRQLLVAVLLGVLVGGGLMAVTPAGAEVSSSMATNWKKIWKKNLKPLADKRYYTKAASDAKYSTKAETAAGDAASQAAANAATDTKLGSYYKKTETDAKYAAAGSSYSKAEADAKYSAAGSSYSKAESDAKYAATPTLIRGTFAMEDSAGPSLINSPISYGVTLSAAATTHYIALGDPVPVGCSGTAAAPNASPGHLCLFEQLRSNVATRNFHVNTAFGSVPYITPTTAGAAMWSLGTWAVRPAALGALPLSARPGVDNGVARPAEGQSSAND